MTTAEGFMAEQGEIMDYRSATFLSNPYAHFRLLRDQSPAYFEPQLKAWLLTSHAGIVAATKAKEISSQIRDFGAKLTPEQRVELAPLLNAFLMRMQRIDHSDHNKIRFQWAHVFSEKSIQRIKPTLSALIGRRMDLLDERGEIDIMQEFVHFPGEALAAYLGISWDDVLRFKPWIDRIVEFIRHLDYDTGKPACDAVIAWKADFDHIVRLKRATISNDEIAAGPARRIAEAKSSQDDVLTAAIKVGLADSEDFFATFLSFFCGRNEPMIASIGSTMLALLERREQYRAVVENPENAEKAAQEGLRFDAPFQIMPRVAAEDWTFGATRIPKGDIIFLVLGAGNRDPERFDKPDEFDLFREKAVHVAYGSGRHFCLASALASLELTQVIRAFATRFPALRLVESDRKWIGDVMYRRMDRLLVRAR
jgi:cytochrome P450